MSDKSDTISDFASLKELLKDVTPIEQNRADIQRPINKPDEGSIEYRRLAAAEKEELIVDGLNSTHHELLSAEGNILLRATSPAPYSLLPSAKSFHTSTIAIHRASPIKIRPTIYSG